MKTWIIITPVIAVSVLIGWGQRRTLARLEGENTALQAKVPGAMSGSRDEPAPAAAEPPPELLPMMARMVELQQSFPLDKEREAELAALHGKVQAALRDMDKEAVFRLTRDAIEGVTDPQARLKYVFMCTQFVIPRHPADSLEFIGGLEGFERESIIYNTFKQCAVKNPARAASWFVERTAAGDPIIKNPQLTALAFACEVRTSPETAVARMFSPEMRGMMEERWMPTNIRGDLRSPAEHRAFIEALRKESERQPDLEIIRTFRSQYVGGLGQMVLGWPFEEATSLLDSEFSPREKLSALSILGGVELPDEAPRWADWMAGITMPDKRDHVVGSFIGNWAQSDQAGAKRWLVNAPDGPARNSGIFGYVCRIAPNDPAEAGRTALELAKGETRRRSLSVTGKYWKEKDPEGYAAFKEENGL